MGGGIVAARTPKPVLQCVKLTAANKVLTVQATDLEVGCTFTITAVEVGEEGSALGKIGASQTYGALPRTLEQAEKDAAYQKRVNDILAKYQLNAPAAQTILNEQRYIYDPGTYQPNPLSQIGAAMPGLAMMLYGLGGSGGGDKPPASFIPNNN